MVQHLFSFMHNVLGEGNWAAAQPVGDNSRALLVAIYLVRELTKMLASQSLLLVCLSADQKELSSVVRVKWLSQQLKTMHAP